MKRPNRVYSEEGEERFYIKNKKGKKVYITTSLSKDKVQKEFIKVYMKNKTIPKRKRRGKSYRNKPITQNELNRKGDTSSQSSPSVQPQLGVKDTIYMTDTEKADNLIKTIEQNRKLYYISQGVLPPTGQTQLEATAESGREQDSLNLLEGRLSQRIDDLGARALQQIQNMSIQNQSKDESILREDKPVSTEGTSKTSKAVRKKKVISFSQQPVAITSSVRQIREIERQNLIRSNIEQEEIIKRLDERILLGSEDTQQIEQLTDLKKLQETQLSMNADIIDNLNSELRDQTFLKENYKDEVIAEQKTNKQLRMGLFQEKVSNILERNKVNKNIDFIKSLEKENTELKETDKERQQIIDKLLSQQIAERKTSIAEEGVIEEKLKTTQSTFGSYIPSVDIPVQVINTLYKGNKSFKTLYNKLLKSYNLQNSTSFEATQLPQVEKEKIYNAFQLQEYNKRSGGVLLGTGQSHLVFPHESAGALYESQIKEIMKKEDAVFCPVIARDEIKDIKIVGNGEPTFFVMNLSKRDDKDGGSHWISVYMDDNDISYFDSFGKDVPSDIKNDLIKLADKDILNTLRKFKINRKVLQKDYQTDCGYRAVEFLDNMLEGKSFKAATNFTEDDMKKLKNKYPTEYI